MTSQDTTTTRSDVRTSDSADSASAGRDAATAPFGALLKDATWDLHQQAERGTLPGMLMEGSISRDQYILMLEQQHAGQAALDGAIVRQRPSVEPLGRLVDDAQLQAPNLAADLRHFGVDPDRVTPKPGARALIERSALAEREHPLSLLAMHYVREGANNGNRFLARKLRPALGASDDEVDGFQHLDPYRDAQREKWSAFKQELNALEVSEADRAACVGAARDMFQIVMMIHRDCESGACNENG